ncbi:MAG: hypothetical protein KatS3mg031_1448 [Chitinophagales bacterium]|nr:MAG: hypothetical protein KatS3mg031_1448 [Chitinophagales bacterium]
MNKPFRLTLGTELFWLLIALLCAAMAAAPVYRWVAEDFLITLAAMGFLVAPYFRAGMFFRDIPYLRFLPIQIGLFFFNIFLFVQTLKNVDNMIFLLESNDVSLFFSGNHLPADELLLQFNFFKKEYLLLSVALLVLIAFCELRVLFALFERIRKIK